MSDAAKTPEKKAAKAKAPKAAPAHPKTSVMVVAAIKALKERNGSSLPAIKKYIAANYKVDTVKLTSFIKKALKSVVEKKAIIQTMGLKNLFWAFLGMAIAIQVVAGDDDDDKLTIIECLVSDEFLEKKNRKLKNQYSLTIFFFDKKFQNYKNCIIPWKTS